MAGDRQRESVVKGLVQRFQECRAEKNGTLIRYDILAVLRRVYDVTEDAEVRSTAVALLDLEEDPKYRKKYATLWRLYGADCRDGGEQKLDAVGSAAAIRRGRYRSP
ncbi:MAG: hypothetical protein ACXVCX_11855 [Ktedonobacterales bacterium]